MLPFFEAARRRYWISPHVFRYAFALFLFLLHTTGVVFTPLVDRWYRYMPMLRSLRF